MVSTPKLKLKGRSLKKVWGRTWSTGSCAAKSIITRFSLSVALRFLLQGPQDEPNSERSFHD